MDLELRKILKALPIPVLMVVSMIALFIATQMNWIDLRYLAIQPMHAEGLKGTVLSVFGHADIQHLISNSIPMLLLAWALFYYYKEFAWKGFILMWLLSGFWVWFTARNSYHVGASGLVYALASFHILSALLRRVFRLMAFAMLVIFLYGGMIWGFFPEFFPERSISWEGHLMGAVAGIIVAIYYRNQGMQRPDPFEEEEEEEEIPIWYHYIENDDENDYSNENSK
jgi:membrane associated rhomboid family serine protease